MLRCLARRVVLDDQLDFTGHGNFGTLRTARQAHLELVEFNLEVARGLRQEVDVTAGRSNLERLHALAARVNGDQLAGLDAERRAVDTLSVNDDVAVHDHLAGLCRGAGDRSADQDGVETHFEQLDQVLTGQSLGATSFLEDDLELCLANAVLGTQALLLAKADSVVTVGLALGAAVLSRRVRTLLEALGGLRGERDAQCPREAGLATCT